MAAGHKIYTGEGSMAWSGVLDRLQYFAGVFAYTGGVCTQVSGQGDWYSHNPGVCTGINVI